MGRAGHLDINIDKVRLADGKTVVLRAAKDEKDGSQTGAMTGAIVATSLVLLPAAPLFLLVHGRDVSIPKGTPITAFIQGDQTLRAKFRPLGQQIPRSIRRWRYFQNAYAIPLEPVLAFRRSLRGTFLEVQPRRHRYIAKPHRT